MSGALILSILEDIQKDLLEIKDQLYHLPKKKIPAPAGFNPMGKKKCFSQRLRGGLMDPEIRSAIMRLRKEGMHFEDIAAYIVKNWPDNPEKHPSRSAIHRFCQAARNGRLEEYGINGTF